MKRILNLLKDKKRLHRILFGEDEQWSKKVDIVIMGAIILCLIIESIESTLHIQDFSATAFVHLVQAGELSTLTPAEHNMIVLKIIIIALEYLLSLVFAAEYLLRVYCSPRKRDYTMSFFGIVDFVATWPQILSFFFPTLRYFAIVRCFRLIRIFRVLKMFTFINEGYLLLESIRKSLTKITVYFLFVLVLVCILGTMMYIVESGTPGTQFTSIPVSIYWAIVTLTTVGYGDITPMTGLGQFFSGIVMILGYTIIAVPTGIVSANIIDVTKEKPLHGKCPRCNSKVDKNDIYCRRCGEKL